jgi:hypothetical protein
VEEPLIWLYYGIKSYKTTQEYNRGGKLIGRTSKIRDEKNLTKLKKIVY